MMKTTVPTDDQRAAMTDLKRLIKKYEHLSAMELLALASQIVGNLIALQDQRTVTVEIAMEVVSQNIQVGNDQATEELMNPEGQG